MDLKCKISVLGDEQVGKTSLILRYVKNTFNPIYKATLGADFIDKEFTSKELSDLKPKDKFILTIWDLAGQKHFEDMSSVYIHGSAGIVLVFDVNEPESFAHLKKWKEMSEKASNNLSFIVVANKSDLYTPTEDELKDMENDLGLPIELASAKTAENVYDVFEKLAKNLLDNFLARRKKT